MQTHASPGRGGGAGMYSEHLSTPSQQAATHSLTHSLTVCLPAFLPAFMQYIGVRARRPRDLSAHTTAAGALGPLSSRTRHLSPYRRAAWRPVAEYGHRLHTYDTLTMLTLPTYHR